MPTRITTRQKAFLQNQGTENIDRQVTLPTSDKEFKSKYSGELSTSK
jgi:hypothetical protein